jgi:hypothetical protein
VCVCVVQLKKKKMSEPNKPTHGVINGVRMTMNELAKAAAERTDGIYMSNKNDIVAIPFCVTGPEEVDNYVARLMIKIDEENKQVPGTHSEQFIADLVAHVKGHAICQQPHIKAPTPHQIARALVHLFTHPESMHMTAFRTAASGFEIRVVMDDAIISLTDDQLMLMYGPAIIMALDEGICSVNLSDIASADEKRLRTLTPVDCHFVIPQPLRVYLIRIIKAMVVAEVNQSNPNHKVNKVSPDVQASISSRWSFEKKESALRVQLLNTISAIRNKLKDSGMDILGEMRHINAAFAEAVDTMLSTPYDTSHIVEADLRHLADLPLVLGAPVEEEKKEEELPVVSHASSLSSSSGEFDDPMDNEEESIDSVVLDEAPSSAPAAPVSLPEVQAESMAETQPPQDIEMDIAPAAPSVSSSSSSGSILPAVAMDDNGDVEMAEATPAGPTEDEERNSAFQSPKKRKQKKPVARNIDDDEEEEENDVKEAAATPTPPPKDRTKRQSFVGNNNNSNSSSNATTTTTPTSGVPSSVVSSSIDLTDTATATPERITIPKKSKLQAAPKKALAADKTGTLRAPLAMFAPENNDDDEEDSGITSLLPQVSDPRKKKQQQVGTVPAAQAKPQQATLPLPLPVSAVSQVLYWYFVFHFFYLLN